MLSSRVKQVLLLRVGVGVRRGRGGAASARGTNGGARRSLRHSGCSAGEERAQTECRHVSLTGSRVHSPFIFILEAASWALKQQYLHSCHTRARHKQHAYPALTNCQLGHDHIRHIDLVELRVEHDVIGTSDPQR
jgi:hypothetical protein